MGTFEANFLSFIDYLKHTPVIKDEWYLSNFIGVNINPLTNEEAFSHLNFIIEYLIKEKDDAINYEIIEIIVSLIRQSDTTQTPSNFNIYKKELINRFSNHNYAQGKINELLRFYRIY